MAVLADRYRVERRLGAGGSGTVFVACDERLGREVAIKRMHGAEVTAQTAGRLRREARILASLRHPGLVTVYDMVMDGDDLLLVMEYVRGETLADVMASGPLSWERTTHLLDPVAAALDYVHDLGVVHRDLKPSNILVGDTGVVKVADLGLATAAEITRITPPGTIVGTPAYMAPEQARAGPFTPAVDIYALATIIFEALSGTRPRVGSTVFAILRQAEREPPPDLRERRPDTPPRAADVLVRAMSAQPEERPRSATELLREMEAACNGTDWAPAAAGPATAVAAPVHAEPPARSTPTPRRSPARERPRAWRTRALALIALAAGLAGVLVLLLVLRGDSRSPPARSDATRPTAATPAAATASATPAPRRPLSATATVRAFYRDAAAGRFPAAWRLAGPELRRAFGDSFDRFRSDLSSLRDVKFERVAVTQRDDTSATVEIQTVATHSDHVERCSGTLRTVRGTDRRWLVEPAGIHCTPA